MSSPELVMVGSYDYQLVALSVAIAVLASYAALDFAGRVTSAKAGIRFLWLMGGAVAMGIGIWSMHYIGMLAFRLPVPVRYDWPTVLVSLLAAIFASAIALFVVSREKMGFIRAIVGSVFMGSAIAGMHYVGMAAMRLRAMCHFSLSIVMISVALAIVISLVALRLTFHLRGETRSGGWRKILSAVVMGAAIPVMHYTGMAAANFTVSDVAPDLSHAVNVSALGTVGIAAVTIMILGIAVLTSAYDRLLHEPRTMRTRVLSARIRALRMAMVTFCVMFVFEAATQALHPKITMWTSHVLTILITTLLAAVLSFIILRKEERFRFELASSEKEYRLLFDSNPLPTWVFARKTLKFLAVNEAAIQHYGFSRQEFLAMTIADIRPEEDIPALLETTAKRIDGLQEAKTWRHRKKDGTNIDVEIVGHELDFQGTEAELVTSHDVSERKQAERTANLLAAIVDSSQDAIISTSLDAIINSWNKGAERLFGYCSEIAIGQSITLIVPSDRRDEEATILERLKRGEWIEQYETVRVRKDGTPLHVALTISPVKDGTGRIVGASKIARDITERKQGEEALRQAKDAAEASSRAKSEFLANMSHEIRTPLNGIMGMTDLTLGTEINAEQREYLDTVKLSADSLLVVINDILDFSKIEAGKVDLELADFNLRDCLESTLKILAFRADEKGLELLCEIAPEVPEVVRGDSSRLRQIVTNLVGNAIKFTNEGEVIMKVEVASQADDERTLQFTVSDTGIGIPQEKQALIFDPFSQADTSTTRKFGGTGLGLTISARLIRLMGGKIWLESEVGGGTHFFFTVQMKSSEMPIAVGSIAPREILRGVKVLVVDDNRTNRRILDGMLKRWEMRTILVEGGEEALVELRAARDTGEPYRLILTDMHMPKMDGFTLVKRIRQRPELATATIMMLTSAGHRGDAERCRELGVAAYLLKPIRQSELRESIALVLGAGERSGAIPLVTRYSLHDARDPMAVLRILVAEDNAVNQRLLVRLLEKRGHRVVLAVDGRQAVEALRQESFDLVLMDVQMPEMGGLEATTIIREKEKKTGKHQPIVALTAHAMTVDRDRCLAAGMDGYLTKPIRPQELEQILDSYVNRRISLPEVVNTR